jgi:hypothetical protein
MEQGYDDHFNQGMFRNSLHNSVQARPKKWPRSVSEMGSYTDYLITPASINGETQYSKFMSHRSGNPGGASPHWRDYTFPNKIGF